MKKKLFITTLAALMASGVTAVAATNKPLTADETDNQDSVKMAELQEVVVRRGQHEEERT